MRLRSILLLLLGTSLWGQVHKSPQEIQAELDVAEDQLKRAEEMFNPWYTGPLLTPSASMMPPGWANVQPYFFVNDVYAAFNSERHSVSFENNLINFNPSAIIQFGVTPSVDTNVFIQTQTNWQNGVSAGGYGDTQWSIGFKIQDQTLYIPKMKFSVSQLFPTGKYQRLRADGLDSTGAGAYATAFSFAMSKIMFWATPHPVNARVALSYRISTPVTVHGYNSYGGSSDTKGRIHPGNAFSVDMGLEVSYDQHWVFANDFVYSSTNRTTFTGKPGTTSTGDPAPIGKGFSDNFSLAPAIEYNWNENLGILGGVQFSVYGRNSGNFVSGILSIEYTFPVGPWN